VKKVIIFKTNFLKNDSRSQGAALGAAVRSREKKQVQSSRFKVQGSKVQKIGIGIAIGVAIGIAIGIGIAIAIGNSIGIAIAMPGTADAGTGQELSRVSTSCRSGGIF